MIINWGTKLPLRGKRKRTIRLPLNLGKTFFFPKNRGKTTVYKDDIAFLNEM
jgi:hypothetical protein